MQVNATIERFRCELKRKPEKAATILELYGANIVQSLEDDDDEQERITAIHQMIDELTRAELRAILVYAITLKRQQTNSNTTTNQTNNNKHHNA